MKLNSIIKAGPSRIDGGSEDNNEAATKSARK